MYNILYNTHIIVLIIKHNNYTMKRIKNIPHTSHTHTHTHTHTSLCCLRSSLFFSVAMRFPASSSLSLSNS